MHQGTHSVYSNPDHLGKRPQQGHRECYFPRKKGRTRHPQSCKPIQTAHRVQDHSIHRRLLSTYLPLEKRALVLDTRFQRRQS